MCMSLLPLPLFYLNLPLSLLHPPPPSLSGDCLHARKVAEGAGEVIQSRISPSHPASWYSYHTVAPWGCLPEYWLTEGDFPLSFQLLLSPAFLSALISPSFLHPFCFSFYLFLARSLLCLLSSSPSTASPCCLSLIVCTFLIVSERMLSAATVVVMATEAICGEQLIWPRS